MHYSVVESNGTVELTIVKKQPVRMEFGYRTIGDTALAVKDYTHKDEIIVMEADEDERIIKIEIEDDDEWEPDLDFFVELYDP